MNRSPITVLAIVLLAIAPATLRADDDSEIFSDDFSTLDEAWGLASSQLRVENNKLVLQPQANSVYTTLYQGNLFDDADIRVQLSEASGALGNPAAIAFWGSDTSNYYVAEIAANGLFAVYRLAGNRWLAACPWQKSDAIKQGLGQTNELRVVTQGLRATFSINGRQVTAIRGFPPDGGSLLGLHAESGNQPYTWEFSTFRVLKAPPATAPAPSGDDSNTIFSDDFATLDPAWGLASDQLRADGNKLIMQPAPKTIPTALYQGNLFGDADIRVQVSQIQGTGIQGSGILFWAVDTNNFYLAEFQLDGSCSISRFMSHQWLFPTNIPQKSDAVRQDLGSTNELRVVTQGNQATFYINGQQVNAIRGFPPIGGSEIGLYTDAPDSADAPVISQFSAFQVLKPPSSGPAASNPGGSDVLFADDFATLDSAWIPPGAPSDTLRVDDHALVFVPPAGKVLGPLYQGTTFDDVDVRVALVESQGNTDRGAGIMFWGTNEPAGAYIAEIQADGGFGIFRSSNGQSSTTIPWQNPDAIVKGVGQTNHLRVVTKGKSATVYINDKQVAAIEGTPPASGSLVGLWASSGDQQSYTWKFSDFSVRKPQ